ncbi:MAG: hypothetical protein M1376_19180 [Planctomycetes bacterium]|nr:hypothetical protein [Planctomycetota bacterium]
MLKKFVFVSAVLLIASASYAALPPSSSYNGVDVEEWDGNNNIKGESWSWPAEYKFQPVCVIPVKMDVGFWVRVVGCKDAVIKLHQDAIRKYSGEVTLTIKCNVAIDLAVDFAKLDGMPVNKDWCKITPSSLQPTGGDVVVSVGLKDVDMGGWKAEQVGTCIQVGNVTIKVRPAVAPQLAGGC